MTHDNDNGEICSLNNKETKTDISILSPLISPSNVSHQSTINESETKYLKEKENNISSFDKVSNTNTNNAEYNLETGQTLENNQNRSKLRELLLKEANYDPHSSSVTRKREDYLPWEEYFMAVAHLSAKRSKDPHDQAGACIVDSNNRVVGIGYNGFPTGCHDDYLPWATSCGKNQQDDNILHTKDPYMCHAEINAILNKCSSHVKGARMYVGEYPGHECAKVIIQSGIREIIYLHAPDRCQDTYRASRIMFEMSGVLTRAFKAESNSNEYIKIDFGPNCNDSNNKNSFTSTSTNSCVENKKTTTLTSFNPLDTNPDRERIKKLLQEEANYNIETPKITKNTSYLSWDDYFMAIAFLSAKRSKDPNTQVGACIVNKEKRIVGIGYNGFPRDCSDDYLPWARKGPSTLHTKYPFVCHAEVNAILNKGSADVVGATLYVALFPCNDCAKMIIQAGITEIVYLNDHYHDTDQCRASRIMFEMAGVKLRYHKPSSRYITLNLNHEKETI